MRSRGYITEGCEVCRPSRWWDDEAWDALLYPSRLNTEMGYRADDSEYLLGRWGRCIGCQRVARRTVKVVALLLYKLEVRI